jgi:hypothetical protein
MSSPSRQDVSFYLSVDGDLSAAGKKNVGILSCAESGAHVSMALRNRSEPFLPELKHERQPQT